MNSRQVCSRLRQEFSISGWALLLYYGIMNLSVAVIMAVDVAVRLTVHMASGHGMTDATMGLVLEKATANGWGYLIAMAVGSMLLYVWKKREFCFKTIWKKERPITAGTFFSLLSLFFGVQAIAQVLAIGMEWFFGLFGLSILESMEAATVIEDTPSMFLYAAVFAPIGEEILFRGLILRTLQPYGRKFSIFGSAFLFGMFHANIIQSPYAFLVGLILGYVTVEYSIIWAIVLHMLNNMVLADFMPRLAQLLPPGIGDMISIVIIWGCAIVSAIILIARRREVADYIRKKIHPLCIKSFFTSPGVLTLSCIMMGNILLTLLLQLIV